MSSSGDTSQFPPGGPVPSPIPSVYTTPPTTPVGAKAAAASSEEKKKVESMAAKASEQAKAAEIVPTQNEIELAIQFIMRAKQLANMFVEALPFDASKMVREVRQNKPVADGPAISLSVDLQNSDDSVTTTVLTGQQVKHIANLQNACDLRMFSKLSRAEVVKKLNVTEHQEQFGSESMFGSAEAEIEKTQGEGETLGRFLLFNTENAVWTHSSYRTSYKIPATDTLSYCHKKEGVFYEEHLQVRTVQETDANGQTVEKVRIFSKEITPLPRGWVNTGYSTITEYLSHHPGIDLDKGVYPSA